MKAHRAGKENSQPGSQAFSSQGVCHFKLALNLREGLADPETISMGDRQNDPRTSGRAELNENNKGLKRQSQRQRIERHQPDASSLYRRQLQVLACHAPGGAVYVFRSLHA